MRRRHDPLIATGVALLLTTLAGHVWFGLGTEWDGPVESSSSVVRLGGSGALAAGLGWAAFAARPGVAVVRSGAVGLLTTAVLLLTLLLASDGSDASFRDADASLPSADTDVLTVLVLTFLLAVLVAGGLGLVARASAVSRAPAPYALALQGLTVAFVLAEGAFQLADGAEVACVIAVLSAAWLVVALRRARHVQQARLAAAAVGPGGEGASDRREPGRTFAASFRSAERPSEPWTSRIPAPLLVIGGLLLLAAIAGPVMVAERVPVLGAAGLWTAIAVLAAMRPTPVGAIAVGGLGFLVVGRLLDGLVGSGDGPAILGWDGLLAYSDAGTPPWGWWSWGGFGALAGIAGRYIVIARSMPGRALASVLLLVPISLEAMYWFRADWPLAAAIAVVAGLWLRLTLEWVRLGWIRSIVAGERADAGGEAGAGEPSPGAATLPE